MCFFGQIDCQNQKHSLWVCWKKNPWKFIFFLFFFIFRSSFIFSFTEPKQIVWFYHLFAHSLGDNRDEFSECATRAFEHYSLCVWYQNMMSSIFTVNCYGLRLLLYFSSRLSRSTKCKATAFKPWACFGDYDGFVLYFFFGLDLFSSSFEMTIWTILFSYKWKWNVLLFLYGFSSSMMNDSSERTYEFYKFAVFSLTIDFTLSFEFNDEFSKKTKILSISCHHLMFGCFIYLVLISLFLFL